MDYANQTATEFYTNIAKEIDDKDVSILVNNVGLYSTKIQRSSFEDYRNCVVVNSISQICMTKALLDKLWNREKRSAIINIGSIGAKCATWYQGPYHSTKAIPGNFGIGEAANLSEKIDTLNYFPCYLVTKFVAKRKEDFITITAEEGAESVCRLVGVTNATYGHYKHQFFNRLLAALKWILGWKNANKSGIAMSNMITRIQYKRKPRSQMNDQEKREHKDRLRQELNDQNTKWSLIRRASIKGVEKIKNVGGKLVRAWSISSKESDANIGNKKFD